MGDGGNKRVMDAINVILITEQFASIFNLMKKFGLDPDKQLENKIKDMNCLDRHIQRCMFLSKTIEHMRKASKEHKEVGDLLEKIDKMLK